MTDDTLLKKAGGGDEKAFVLLYERYNAGLYRFVYRFLESAELAREITDDCLLDVVRHYTNFDPSRASLRTYLYAAARNKIFSQFRHRDESLTDNFDEALNVSDGNEPLKLALQQELSEKVRHAISELPPLQREVVILFEYEEFTLPQIAEIVGADVGAVKSRLFRARGRLRRSLAPYFKSDSAIASSVNK